MTSSIAANPFALLASGLIATVFATHVFAKTASTTQTLSFSSTEIAQILQHGPWPLPSKTDAGNRFSANAQAIELGQQLFFDKRLSPDGRMSCASCHVPTKAFADGLAQSMGRVKLDRNAPSLWNAVHERWQGWDGASDSLWSQAIRPLIDPKEMASSAKHVAQVIASDKQLSCRWEKIFGGSPLKDPDTSLVQAAKAIGAFNASLISAPTPFDGFRDALAQGDTTNPTRYPISEQRGLRLFVGRGQCNLCHVGPMFSNGEFGDTGIPFFVRKGVVDSGRFGGIETLKASRFNLLSRWSDDSAELATKTRHVDLQHRNFGEFKVPSLRNVAQTAPYMHNGHLNTLRDVVLHYSRLNVERLHADGEQILRPFALSETEIADLTAFMRSLSDAQSQKWQMKKLTACTIPK